MTPKFSVSVVENKGKNGILIFCYGNLQSNRLKIENYAKGTYYLEKNLDWKKLYSKV